jgi:pimeloyl-ACP methyl ester carboxylesterase
VSISEREKSTDEPQGSPQSEPFLSPGNGRPSEFRMAFCLSGWGFLSGLTVGLRDHRLRLIRLRKPTQLIGGNADPSADRLHPQTIVGDQRAVWNQPTGSTT